MWCNVVYNCLRIIWVTGIYLFSFFVCPMSRFSLINCFQGRPSLINPKPLCIYMQTFYKIVNMMLNSHWGFVINGRNISTQVISRGSQRRIFAAGDPFAIVDQITVKAASLKWKPVGLQRIRLLNNIKSGNYYWGPTFVFRIP